MPKIKTNRAAAKRFKRTATGKIRRNKAFSNHILTKKTTKRKRQLRSSALIARDNFREVRRLLPNAGI
jgi:large subunit ribosomal protein L35